MGKEKINIPIHKVVRITVASIADKYTFSLSTNGVVSYIGTSGIVFNSHDGIEYYFTFEMIKYIQLLDDKNKEKM